MGAKVTSIDICKRQLDIARRRAAVLGAAVDFVCADVVDLSALGDAAFDVVYTGGHVAVWVSDLERYYREATRLLRPDGLLIVSEYHPFRRIWRRAATLEIGTDYFDRGPHRFHAAADVLNHESGELEQFEFHWTVADYISAILGTHCRLIHVEEFGASCEAWEGAPIPACRNHCCWSPAATPDAAHAFMYLRSQYRHRGAVCGIGICHPAMPRDPLRQFPSEGAGDG